MTKTYLQVVSFTRNNYRKLLFYSVIAASVSGLRRRNLLKKTGFALNVMAWNNPESKEGEFIMHPQ